MGVLKNIRNELLMLSIIPEIIYHCCRAEIDKNYKWGNEMFSEYAKWVTKEVNDENDINNGYKRKVSNNDK